ncbi:hypothetical protein HPB49_003842 [Dermacentor silvarum]|uniref:Uncharacterized protein n=1 Tax=Dermacentor silvarum TaxID=543639 RepID=A0ACB8D2P4_DERSI|nr:hypothetical protein HPB49_003842 [Dermacentor silvarum]
MEACFNCRRAGHRADVCPREKTNICNRCGTQHPAKEPTGLHAEMHPVKQRPFHGHQKMQGPLRKTQIQGKKTHRKPMAMRTTSRQRMTPFHESTKVQLQSKILEKPEPLQLLPSPPESRQPRKPKTDDPEFDKPPSTSLTVENVENDEDTNAGIALSSNTLNNQTIILSDVTLHATSPVSKLGKTKARNSEASTVLTSLHHKAKLSTMKPVKRLRSSASRGQEEAKTREDRSNLHSLNEPVKL